MMVLRFHRGAVHRRHVVEAMMDDLREQHPDHVVITGDLTNLALDTEFALARAVIHRLGMDPTQVSIVPGNHDLYTRGAQRGQRFVQYFSAHITSDIALAAADAHPSGPFPYVRLRGPIALIGVSTAVARLPLFASGHVGRLQLNLLAAVLIHPEVARRTAVVLMHHPIVNPVSRLSTFARGLSEAQDFQSLLRSLKDSVVLHGHLHHRVRRVIHHRDGGSIHHFGATSASLVHPHPDRMAGYNIYDFADDGTLTDVHARVWNPALGTFAPGSITDAA